MRTAMLLGAGASRAAGLPLTIEFARELVERLNKTSPRDAETAALNFVYGAMVNHATERGGDPLGAVNVETMFSAVRLLARRDTHEVAPFVNWKPGVGVADSSKSAGIHFSSVLKNGVGSALGIDGHSTGEPLLEVLVELIRSEVGHESGGEVFASLELRLRELIVTMLARPKNVDYLSPIAELAGRQAGGLDVATLNYDLTIELMARAQNTLVNTGVQGWSAGTPLVFDPADRTINLIKLHGSIDWVNERGAGSPGRLPQTATKQVGGHDALSSSPAIVIGDREKLETEGATLHLMRAFVEALARADRLVIVGYSGGDAHVNTVIREWANAHDTRTIAVVDPGWPRSGFHYPKTFAHELNQFFGASARPGIVPRRLYVFRGPAEEELSKALASLPEVDPEPWFEIASEVEDEVAKLTVTNRGRALGKTEFYPEFRTSRVLVHPWPLEFTVHHPSVKMDKRVSNQMVIPSMAAGEVVHMTLRFENAEQARRWAVRVRGKREIDWAEAGMTGEDAEPDSRLG